MRILRTAALNLRLLAILLCAASGLSGCSTTPQSELHGRWFNSEMSIRFRTDGTVIFNSTQGLATGRYFFDGEVRPDASEEPVPNLTMDLQRNGEVFRVIYELQFLGNKRLRISPVEALERGRVSDGIRPILVLQRAENEDVNGVAAAG